MTDSDTKASVLLYQGAVTASACWLAAILAFAAHLENPWWAAISAWVVASPVRQALLTKAADRIVGTILGCSTGYWLTLWGEGRPALQTAILFMVAAVGTYARFRSKHSYAWIIGAASAMMILSTGLEAPGQTYYLALSRATEIICGVLAATFMGLVVDLKRWIAGMHSAPTEPTPKARTATMDRADAIRLAMMGGVTIILVPILWSWWHLPSLTQTIVSSFVVLDRDVLSTRFRGVQRILGCLAGGAFGLLTIWLGIDSFFMWSIMLLAGVFLFSRSHHSDSRWSYVGTQGGVAFLLAVITGNGPPDSIMPAINRIAGMLSGVAILLGVSLVFGRTFEYERTAKTERG